jgi:hypothetical protein
LHNALTSHIPHCILRSTTVFEAGQSTTWTRRGSRSRHGSSATSRPATTPGAPLLPSPLSLARA